MSQEKNLVDEFILAEIDTVPHLEALLLLWKHRPEAWSVAEMARALYVEENEAAVILDDLKGTNLVTGSTKDGFRYTISDRDSLLPVLDQTYRRELIRITRMIHSKGSSAIRDFARAFRLKKEQQ